MEELLNKLIEKGWKPFGWKDIKRANNEGWFVCFVHKSKKQSWLGEVSYRELVSKESGLWQFVCENGMRPKRVGYEEHHWQRDNHTNGRGMVMESEPEYRLIESSLKDESELEQFLFQSIVIDNE